MATTRTVDLVDLAELLPEPKNARRRGVRAEATLGASMGEFGAARSIVVDGSGTVRAGNGTLKAAREAGITKAIVVETDGKHLVVVKRPDWDEITATRYGLADNQSALLAEYDNKILAEILEELGGTEQDLVAIGWETHEVEPLLQADWTPPESEGDLVSFVASGGKAIRLDQNQWQKVLAALQKARSMGADGDDAELVAEICESWAALAV